MNQRELITRLAELGVRPSRRLGQNFLVDGNLLAIMAAPASAGTPVVEIGAGTGELTARLRAQGAEVVALEYDRRLYEYLLTRFPPGSGVRLIHADAARVDYDALLGAAPYQCIASLPYSAASAIIARLLEAINRPVAMHLLVQRDMAERLVATPGGKAYGRWSVLGQSCCTVRLERILPPSVFWPAPQVDSALVSLSLRPDAPTGERYRRLSAVLAAAFGQRRKQLANALRGSVLGANPAAALRHVGIAPAARAEELTVAQFLALAATTPIPA